MEIKNAFSAANCIIEVARRQVGMMQSLNASIDYGVYEVRNLWQGNVQGFVRGVTSINLNAKRAIVEADTIFGDSKVVSLVNSYLETLDQNIPSVNDPFGVGTWLSQADLSSGREIAAVAIQILGGLAMYSDVHAEALPNIKNLQNIMQAVINGVDNFSNFFSHIPFDIKVKVASIKPGTSLIEDFLPDPEVLWKFSGCKLRGRSLSLDIGNIILMEDITVFARDFAEPIIVRNNLA